MARLFVAVRPDDETCRVLDEVLGVPRPSVDGVRWVPPDQWHVTLRFWADADPAPIIDALDTVQFPTVSVMLGPVISRLGRTAVVVPAAGAEPLAEMVASAIGVADPRPFNGHLTVARLRHRAACGIAGGRLTSTFIVSVVELVRSELSSSGAIHTSVARWSTISES